MMVARVNLTSELPVDLPPDALLSHGSFLINLEGEQLPSCLAAGGTKCCGALVTPCSPTRGRDPGEQRLRHRSSSNLWLAVPAVPPPHGRGRWRSVPAVQDCASLSSPTGSFGLGLGPVPAALTPQECSRHPGPA